MQHEYGAALILGICSYIKFSTDVILLIFVPSSRCLVYHLTLCWHLLLCCCPAALLVWKVILNRSKQTLPFLSASSSRLKSLLRHWSVAGAPLRSHEPILVWSLGFLLLGGFGFNFDWAGLKTLSRLDARWPADGTVLPILTAAWVFFPAGSLRCFTCEMVREASKSVARCSTRLHLNCILCVESFFFCVSQSVFDTWYVSVRQWKSALLPARDWCLLMYL